MATLTDVIDKGLRKSDEEAIRAALIASLASLQLGLFFELHCLGFDVKDDQQGQLFLLSFFLLEMLSLRSPR